MPSIRDLLVSDSIDTAATAADWREAIAVSGALLTRAGVASERYTELMIESVETRGPYIVLAPGFALAHARPDPSVQRTGLSFARFAEPVAFHHEKNDPVTIVMALAATDDAAHREALAQVASVLADPDGRRALDIAPDAAAVLDAFDPPSEQVEPSAAAPVSAPATTTQTAGASTTPGAAAGTADDTTDDTTDDGIDDAIDDGDTVPSKQLILTVCGNGVGTSLFLKSTAEKVLGRWGWSPYLSVEATDTISAKGKAQDADLILTSGAIAEALGDVGTPVQVIDNFTSTAEVDAALRRQYAV